MAAGANAILGKPLSVQALNKAIIELDSTKPQLSLVSTADSLEIKRRPEPPLSIISAYFIVGMVNSGQHLDR